ncbi:MAG: multifunctional oxoglutarate decarboxylase/oxoglutarate dehydrogenase thiamine pyrophosphate-binding subunit/dihydrolipoyllysine-residue succinyltransferase subunit, partial [Candidatus Eremiobacteraeota bacterium]|nr:multifunctional oxoglutarate decarboxylase/oxoglutarate dehydrogenase thiamine pyrophosphate-binding subunit/dihydrolipoyllysine-residue succinyltransferase subunit [Candidatus Eremiobacteraeota bacterium]
MGESVAEGTVTSWRKRVGDTVTNGEPLVDVTTDKVDVEVPAPASGKLVKIIAQEGDTVKVGSPLGEIDVSGDGSSAKTAVQSARVPSATAESAKPRAEQPASAVASSPSPGAGASAGAGASPLAKRAAAQRGIDLSSVRGSGPGGIIRRDDVVNGRATSAQPVPPKATDGHIEAAAAPLPPTSTPVPAQSSAVEGTPLRGPAAALVTHMEESLRIPTATSFRTIAVDTLEARRRDLNSALRTAGRDEKVSYTHVIGYAIAQATKAVPVMTSAFRRDGEHAVRIDQPCNLGLAVDMVRKDGSRFLIVPVIRNADALDFAEFHRTYEALVAKARTGALTPPDLAGASMTLTNPGGIGTVASVPRLLAGQGTIVATGAISYPPGLASVPESSLRSMGVAKIMTLTSTYDHRIIQGAQSGEFLRRIEELLNGADSFYDALFASLALPKPGAIAKIETRVPGAEAAPGAPIDLLRAATGGAALVARYRNYGHTAATLDPLGEPPTGDPSLDPASLNLTLPLMEAVPASILRLHLPGNNLAEVLPRLRETYCGTIAYQMEHISRHEERGWLREHIESGAHRRALSREDALRVLDSLTSVETFERYLRRSFLGQKTFSIEGLDAMIPMLQEAVDLLGADGTGEVDLGMAHRGRLAVITHVIGRPFEEALREFEMAEKRGEMDLPGDVTGDVKYHQGAEGVRHTASGKDVHVVLASNPSHLEAVDAVVEGRTRASQTDRAHNIATVDAQKAAALLVHGDAAFPAQGVVAEVLNMQALPGYTTGGTIHIIANNQIGFTTTPGEGRSTRYASDLAKGFDLPIIHVNADDIEACLAAVRLCVAFRKQFKRDILIDLVGYRRFGHNETDEPAYTQPIMYERIKNHPTVREIYARRLVEHGVVSQDEVNALSEKAQERIKAVHTSVKAEARQQQADASKNGAAEPAGPQTRVAAGDLRALNERLLELPDGFTVHPKLARQLERRRAALGPGGDIDWALGESFAFGTLLQQGTPIRLTGQDTERGTFSQRHIVLHDPKTGDSYAPLQHLDARASFEVHNSPLSEYACVGFEYGYSAAAPNALVLWEAQFGDFFNGAQIIMDQFISAGQAKWGESPRLTLLLPHGYEGAGPEHSSARLERFLQLAGDNNLRIANTTTPAQYFHLLRDQALRAKARPLVLMTPKSLLRLKAASSTLADFTDRDFMPVIDDPAVRDRKKIERLILCSGKIYYDLTLDALRQAATDLAIARVELLEPFPLDDVLALVKSYPALKTVAWVQEEPKNMGARAFVSRRLRERLAPMKIAFGYVGRPDRASPSEGYPGAHTVEQERIIRESLSQSLYKE